MPPLTDFQRTILRRLNGAGPDPRDNLHVRGAEVRAARALERLGLLVLEDNGLGPDGRNGDGEQWSARLTPAGRDAATIERDAYAKVWSLTPESARRFFGQPADAEVVVLKEKPESERELARYAPEAKLFGVAIKEKR